MADQIAGKGSLSKNEKKATDKHPGMLGSITFSDDIPAGTKLYLATWMNTNDNGDYLSVRATWPLERSGGDRAERPAPSRFGSGTARRELDDEIPF